MRHRFASLARTPLWVWAGLILAWPGVQARAELPAGWDVEINAGTIRDMTTDGGMIACATDGGLLFFQPQTSTFAQIADAGCVDGNCLRSNRLTAIARDDNGNYWTGTERSGVVVYRPNSATRTFDEFFTANFASGGFLSDSITCIDVWKSEAVYAGTPIGVAQIDLEAGIETYNEASSRRAIHGLYDQNVNDVAVDSLYVWVAQDSGVVRYLRQPNHDLQRLSTGFSGDAVNVIEIQAGQVYAGTDLGLYLWEEASSSWQRIVNMPSEGPTPDFDVHCLARVGGSNRLLIGGSTVRTFNGVSWGFLNPPALLLIEGRSFAAMAASGDTVWTGQINANGEGNYLEAWNLATGWQQYEPNGIPVSENNFVGFDAARSELWVATRLAGVARRSSTGEWCVYNGNDDIVNMNMTDPSGRVSAFLVDQSGSAWFTTLPILAATNVDRLDPDPNCVHADDVWSHIMPDDFGFGGRYRSIREDGDGHRYFLSDGNDPSPGGIDILSQDGTLSANIRADLLGGGAVGALAFNTLSGGWTRAYVGVSARGQEGLLVWFNSGDIADIFQPTDTNFSTLPLETFSVTDYRAIAVESNGDRFWVATDDGLFQYSNSERRVLREVSVKTGAAPGLLSGDLKDVLIDGFNNLWIASVNGLNRIDLNRLETEGLAIDAYSTRLKIAELNDNAPPGVGRLYDPRQTISPLPAAKVNSLAYDAERNLLYAATETGMVSINTAILGVEAAIPIDRAFVYPNPYDARLPAFRQGLPDGVFIGGINEAARLTVFNLEGELVFETFIENPGESNPSFPHWDLRTVTGFEASSGVYLIRVRTSQGAKTTPLVVIR